MLKLKTSNFITFSFSLVLFSFFITAAIFYFAVENNARKAVETFSKINIVDSDFSCSICSRFSKQEGKHVLHKTVKVYSTVILLLT